MVVEVFRGGDAAPVYKRYEEEGRLLPDGLVYLDSWVAKDRTRCYQLMECEDEALLALWMARWEDLVEFSVVPVIDTDEARSGGSCRAR